MINITKILLIASMLLIMTIFTMNNDMMLIVNAQSEDECSNNICSLIENGICMSREKCADLGEKFTWNDSLCTKDDDKCGCCFPKDTTKSPTRPSLRPTEKTDTPANPYDSKTASPTGHPFSITRVTMDPTTSPTNNPAIIPTENPAVVTTKTRRPTLSPTIGLRNNIPTNRPTENPVLVTIITRNPTTLPTNNPIIATIKTRRPTRNPTATPTMESGNDIPTSRPTENPVAFTRITRKPTNNPTNNPTKKPFITITGRPTKKPLFIPQCLTFDPVCSQKGGFCRVSPGYCPSTMKRDSSLCGSSENCFCCLPINA